MTLILSVLYDNFAIQVSDRRLTDQNGKLFDDESNKAILLENRIAISYTGLGFINGKRTDEWLAQTLINIQAKYQTQDLAFILNELKNKATTIFEKIQVNKFLKRHAFVGVGWTISEENNFMRLPIVFSLSNAQDNQFNWFPEATNKFSLNYRIGKPNTQLVFVLQSGQDIPNSQFKELLRNIYNCWEHKTSPEPVVRLLVDAIRKLSNQEKTVGKNLMVVCIPKQLNSELVYTTGRELKITSEKNITFRYMSPNRENVQFSPIAVYYGNGGMKFESIDTNESGSDSIITLKRTLPKI